MKRLYPVLFRHILVLAVICMAFLLWMQESSLDQPRAKGGVLDLTHWDFNTEGRTTLSGEWEFHWSKFLSYEDYKADSRPESIYVRVPQIWNRYQLDGQNLPGFGYATYHLKVKVPDTKTILGLRISSMSTAYECYINDRLIAQNGKISTSQEGSRPEYAPVSVSFAPPMKEFDIIVHVSNYEYARGGMWFDIDLGTAKQMIQYDSHLKYRDGIVIGMLSIMAIYFFCYFYMFREDRKNFSFMLMSIILIVRTSLYGDYFIVQLFPDISFRLLVWLSYLTLFWFPVILYQMIEFYMNDTKTRSLIRPFYFYGIIMSVITAFTPVAIYTQWTAVIDAMAVFIFVSAIVKAFLACLNKVPGTNIILHGSLIIGLTGMHDMLYQANLIHSRVGELTPIGLILFMLLLFILMADKVSKTYYEVQSLSKELAEKLKLEQDLTERLYALDKMKDDFLANTSYELRSPLNGIINITQSVLQGIGGDLNSVQTQNLEVVLNSTKKLYSIINDLLDVSLLRSGGIQIHRTSLDIRTLVGNMTVVFQHLKKNETIALINEIPSAFPLLYADEVRLRQILNNLLGNALKFTESGTITISASQDGEWARLCIEDTGCGIAAEKLDRIFNAFEQVDGTIQRKYESTGLGLYITRQLVELHDGKIWITSEPGKGTQVCFTIPLSQDQEIASSVSSITQEEETNIHNFMELELPDNEFPFNILAVDADRPSLQALTNILHLSNYNVKGISSGKEALRLLENGAPFELVILDVMMPELSGFEVLEVLRKKYNRLELPVLMLTSKSQNEAMSLCFKLGANDYLIKPFEVDELLARVNSMVRLKRAVNKLVNSEMSFLQAQIKPHFIHNALSVISSLSIKDPHKAKSLILDLSDYLRGSFDLNNDKGLTTLSKELELVRAYLSIEQARFRERLQVHYHLLEDVDCTLPLLTIQPLVENAIRHGIMCRMEGGEIHITISLEPDRVRIEVRDNGVGIEPERIEKFFELKQEQRGVGMANIHRRLMTQYGEGLHIESIPNKQTVIYFYIPYHSGKEVLV